MGVDLLGIGETKEIKDTSKVRELECKMTKTDYAFVHKHHHNTTLSAK